MNLSPEQIECAVNWWRNALDNPRFDNGDDSRDGGMAMIFMTILHHETKPVDQQKEIFLSALHQRLQQDWNEWGDNLYVDYQPEDILHDVVRLTGYKGAFPWKTEMVFRDGGVQVRCGYGKPMREILKSEAHP